MYAMAPDNGAWNVLPAVDADVLVACGEVSTKHRPATSRAVSPSGCHTAVSKSSPDSATSARSRIPTRSPRRSAGSRRRRRPLHRYPASVMAGAWYVGRASWRRRWRGLVFLGLFAGLVGGAILAASAGAAPYGERLRPAAGGVGRTPRAAVRHRPGREDRGMAAAHAVGRSHRGAAGLIGRQSPQQNWYSLYAFYDASPLRSAVFERGRLPRADRPEEVAISVRTARNTGLDVGDELVFDSYAARPGAEAHQEPMGKPGRPARRAEGRRHRARPLGRPALADHQGDLRDSRVRAAARRRSGGAPRRHLVEGRARGHQPVPPRARRVLAHLLQGRDASLGDLVPRRRRVGRRCVTRGRRRAPHLRRRRRRRGRRRDRAVGAPLPRTRRRRATRPRRAGRGPR